MSIYIYLLIYNYAIDSFNTTIQISETEDIHAYSDPTWLEQVTARNIKKYFAMHKLVVKNIKAHGYSTSIQDNRY